MRIKLSDHFTYKKLLKFALPGILMMIFTSLYTIVDGIFVSNFAPGDAFAGLNFIYPVIGMLSAIGFMIGAGGTALIGKTLGEKDNEKANSYFSLLVVVTIVLSIILIIPTYIFMPDIITLLKGEGELAKYALSYGRTLLLFLPFFMLQMEFQSFFIVAEKPNLNIYLTIIAGVINMGLDALFIVGLKLDVFGAALGTGISQFFGGFLPILYFLNKKNNSLLKLGKFKFEWRPILKSFSNGSSEFITNIAISVMGLLFNVQLLNYIGNKGVSAYGVIMYVSLLFLSIFFGYDISVASIISYNYGAKNKEELKNVTRKSLVIFSISSILMCILSYSLTYPLGVLFSGGDNELKELTIRAFLFYSSSFLFCSYAIFGSNLFTALNNGLISFIISILRSFVFQLIFVLVLPLIFGSDGIWLSIPMRDFFSLIPSLIFFIVYKRRYGY